MNQDLQKARELLAAGDYTCVVCQNGTAHTTHDRGVKPLLTWLDQGLDLKDFSAADRVVGRATAFLYVLLGVRAVSARVMSQPAVQVLQAHGIEAWPETLVPGIINRQGSGPCPFEEAVLTIHDPAQALDAIRARRVQMLGGS